jgi:hypothetical protein
MKLISMTDFVLQGNGMHEVVRYANFLKKPLELWMFVPCDENGNVLEEPLHIELYEGDTYDLDCKLYKESKERCLFEGFEKSADYIQNSNKCFVVVAFKISIGLGFKNGMHQTIEDLTKYNLQLTQTAIKQLGL